MFRINKARVFSEQMQRLCSNALKNNIKPCRSFSKLNSQDCTVSFSNGRTISFSSGKYARFANGTAVCKMGDTSVLVTAVARDTNASGNFMPLTVDFRQKYAAAGRIPANFFRRELGATEKEILSARLIDRSLRPLFPEHFKCETQLVCNMLALDSINSPDVLSINAASLALALSDIPWDGPVGAVRLGLVDDEIIINPTRLELQSSSMDLVLTARKNRLVVMLEGKANIVPYQTILKSIKKGITECQQIINAIENMQKTHGKEKRKIEVPAPIDQEIVDAVRSLCEMRLNETLLNYTHDKTSRDQAVKVIREDVVNRVWSSYPSIDRSVIADEFNKIYKEIFRELIFQGKRCDGRLFDELRKISCEVNLHDPLHGSALFQRGQTQVMSTVALDSIDSAMKLDTLTAIEMGLKSKNFFLHYEFPPYATGEIGRIGGVGRREIGHGALAEKGLVPIIPQNYPFTVRLTSEVLESNGSSSMATVCGGSLALMDAGVPIIAPAAGVAIGLVTKYKADNPYELEDYRILTDILGIEDYLGDMDMKVASTKKGITAIQADVKTCGIPLKVLTESFERASIAKNTILDIMAKCIHIPRQIRKECWPVTSELVIEPNRVGQLIGPGGMNVKKIFLQTGAHLTEIKPGTFNIFAPSQMALNETQDYIQSLLIPPDTLEFEFGAIYTAKIVEIKDVGVMVTLHDSMKPTFIHIAQLDNRRVANPLALGLEVGQEIKVKYFGIDPVSGYMRLSRKLISNSANEVVVNLNN